jgi:hypothetical protein
MAATYTVVIGSIPATFSVSGISVPADIIAFMASKRRSNTVIYYGDCAHGRRPYRSRQDIGGIIRISGLVRESEVDSLKAVVSSGEFTIAAAGLSYEHAETREFNMKKNANQIVFFTGSFSYANLGV